MFKRKKKTGCETPAYRRTTPPPNPNYGIVYTDDDFDEVNADVLNWLTPVCIVN